MALPTPGIIRTEISQLNAQRNELLGMKEGLKNAIAELNDKKSELQSELSSLYKALEEQGLPDSVKGQIQERLTLMQNAKTSIDSQLKAFQDRLNTVEASTESLHSGIDMRKDLLTKLMGSLAQQSKATQQNRETGRIKG